MGIPVSIVPETLRSKATLTLEPIEDVRLQWNNSYNVNAADREKPRYLRTTYTVTNYREDDLREAVLVALKRDGISKAGTAITAIQSFGSANAPVDPQQVMPANAMKADGTVDNGASDLQVLLPEESGAIEQTAKALGEIRQNDVVLDYGFVVRNASGGHVIRGTRSNGGQPGTGSITFSFRVPASDNAADDAYRFDMSFLLVTMDVARVTQGVEEQGDESLFAARKSSAAATEVISLAGTGLVGQDVSYAAYVRTADESGIATYLANPASEPSFLGFIPAPNAVAISATSDVKARLKAPVASLDSNPLRVYGSLTGARSGVSGTAWSSVYAWPNGLRSGESVDVTLLAKSYTNFYLLGLSATEPGRVMQFRISSSAKNPNANFTIPTTKYSTVAAPNSLALGDIDGDGDVDGALAVPNAATATSVYVFVNGGAGTLTQKSSTSGLKTPSAASLADTDADGKFELYVGGTRADSKTVPVIRKYSLADPTLGTYQDIELTSVPSAIVAGDLNADGYIDLVVASQTADGVSALIRQADGSFKQSVLVLGTLIKPWALAVGDFNNDYRMDVAVADRSKPGTVVLLLNSAVGQFAVGGSVASIPTPTTAVPMSVTAGDWNRDGLQDLAASFDDGSIAVWMNSAGGKFPSPQRPALNGTFRTSDLVSGDWDGDGDLDLAVAGNSVAALASGKRRLNVLLNDGHGLFAEHAAVAVDLANEYGSPEASPIRSADLDGDGDLDLAIAKSGGLMIAIGGQ